MDEHVAAKCVAHPLRRQILDQLGRGPLSPNEVAGRLGEPLTNVSYHVRMLHEWGALELMDTAPRRGAVEHFYRRAVRIAPLRVNIDDKYAGWSLPRDMAAV